MNREEMYQQFGLSADVLTLDEEVLHDIEDRCASIDERPAKATCGVLPDTVIMTAVGTHWKKYMRIFSIVKMPWSALRSLVELMH